MPTTQTITSDTTAHDSHGSHHPTTPNQNLTTGTSAISSIVSTMASTTNSPSTSHHHETIWSSATTSSAVITENTTTAFDWTILPPIEDQICLQAGIKKPFYSILGNHYCQQTCLFRPMDECNLYLCFCSTQYLSTKN